jgi:hypothetical protein
MQAIPERTNGRTYDALEFLTPEGEMKTIYFDISGYFPPTGYALSNGRTARD